MRLKNQALMIASPLLFLLIFHILFNLAFAYRFYDTQIFNNPAGKNLLILDIYSPAFMYTLLFMLLSLVSLFKKIQKWVKYLLYALSFCLCFLEILEIYTVLNYGWMIEASLVSILLNEASNAAQNLAFFKDIAPSFILFLVLLLCLVGLIYLVLKRPFTLLLQKLFTLKYFCLSLVLYAACLGGSYYFARSYKGVFFAGNTLFNRIDKTIRYTKENQASLKAFKNSKRILPKGLKLNSNKPHDIVFILGESANRSHFSLYGYRLDTTPRLNALLKKGLLVKFSNALAPADYTYKAVPLILSLASLSNKSSFLQKANIIDILNALNFQTTWLSNQENSSVKPGGSYQVIALRSKIYGSNVKKFFRSYKHFDFGLLKLLKDVSPAKNSFTLLHTLGQHLPYYMDTPDDFKGFSEKDYADRIELNEAKKKILAQYDSAALYTDEFIQKVYEMYKDKNALLVYISDHGENVYDEVTWLKQRSKPYDRYQFEVPFFFIATKSWQESHPKKWAYIKAARNRPFMSDDLIYALLDLCDVSFDGFDESLNVLSPLYKPHKRCVENYCYDK